MHIAVLSDVERKQGLLVNATLAENHIDSGQDGLAPEGDSITRPAYTRRRTRGSGGFAAWTSTTIHSERMLIRQMMQIDRIRRSRHGKP